jgi:hypothetical protein
MRDSTASRVRVTRAILLGRVKVVEQRFFSNNVFSLIFLGR